MEITLHNTYNTRDLGGLKTRDNKVIKRGKLFRSDSLLNADQDDLKKIKDLNLDLVIDLRSQDQMGTDYSKALTKFDFLKYRNNPMIAKDDRISKTKEELETPLYGFTSMIKVYSGLVSDQVSLKSLRKTFQALADPEIDNILINCQAGKDRTGVTVALILSTLGVGYADIEKDYLKSTQAVAPYRKSVLAKEKDNLNAVGLASLSDIYRVRSSYLNLAFHYIIDEYGSIDTFVEKELKVTPEMKESIREQYLENA